jgi:hypothetical protein
MAKNNAQLEEYIEENRQVDMKGTNMHGTNIHSAESVNFKQCVTLGNALAIVALSIMILSISMSFFFDQYFSLTSQVAAHISTIISAGIVKLGYVIRCVGAHGLGHAAY